MTTEDHPFLFKVAAATLREQKSAIRELKEKVAELQKRDSDHTIALQIVELLRERGQDNHDLPTSEKVAMLMGSGKDLSAVKESIERTAPDMSFASLTSRPTAASSSDRLTNLINGINE